MFQCAESLDSDDKLHWSAAASKKKLEHTHDHWSAPAPMKKTYDEDEK